MQGAKEFLEEIKQQLIEQKNLGLIESVFFPLRFADDRPLDYQHKQIAIELMPKDPRLCKDGQYANSIGTNVQKIVHAMADLYLQEMQDDGLDPESLKNRKRGEKGAWLDIYDWLWGYKFKRWLEKNAWSILQKQANMANNWIQLLTNQEISALHAVTKAPSLRLPPPEIKPTISVNEELWMKIDLKSPNHQLLLFNQSEQGKYLLCPSFGYAMNPAIEKPPLLLPQKDSYADKTDQKFIFKEAGQEDFLAIVLDKPLNLPWLTPRQEDALPELTGERIKELFEALEKQDNWQVFYQGFEVVNMET